MEEKAEPKFKQSRFQEDGTEMKNTLEKELIGPAKTKIFKHQIQATLATLEYFERRGHENPALIVAPTGSGKTGIIAMIPYVLMSRQTMILTPSPIISQQIKSTVATPMNPSTFLEKVGWFPSSWTEADKNDYLPTSTVIEFTKQINFIDTDLAIVNAQKFGGQSNCSLLKKDSLGESVLELLSRFFRKFDLLIVDEAHHYPAPIWKAIISEFKAKNPKGRMVFLTATPFHNQNGKKKRILPEECEVCTITRTTLSANVIREFQFLELNNCEPEENNPTSGDPFSQLWIETMGEEVFGQLERQDILEKRFQHQAMILMPDKRKAIELTEIFNAIIPNSTRAIIGGSRASRNNIRDFRNGNYRVAVVCHMLTEGFDNPSVSLCVIYRGVASQLLFEQFLGRCLRKYQFDLDEYQDQDQTKAMLLTYKCFQQKTLFKNQESPLLANKLDLDELFPKIEEEDGRTEALTRVGHIKTEPGEMESNLIVIERGSSDYDEIYLD